MLARPVHPTGHAERRTGARPGAAGAGVGAHRPCRPGAGIRREARAETRVLDTGPLRVTVPGGVATLAELAAGPHRAQPIPPPTLHVEGAAPATPTIARVAVETAGPVRTELLVSGRYPQGIDYEARLA